MTLFILFLSSHVKHYTFFYAHNVNTQQKVMSDFPGNFSRKIRHDLRWVLMFSRSIVTNLRNLKTH